MIKVDHLAEIWRILDELDQLLLAEAGNFEDDMKSYLVLIESKEYRQLRADLEYHEGAHYDMKAVEARYEKFQDLWR
jgi:hypothetical protein